MKYRFKTKPYKHQVDALRKMLRDPCKSVGAGLFMEMGTGKTKTVIDYACIKNLEDEIDRVFIVAPLSVLGVWNREIRLHAPENTIEWRAVNYDKLAFKRYFEEYCIWVRDKRTLLVFDESHKIKNPQAKRTRAAFVLSKLSTRVIVMTGTPIEKHPLDLYSQMKVIDEAIVGNSWGAFKKTYAVWGGYGGYQLLKYMNLDRLKLRVDPFIFQAKKKDCLDLPKKSHQIVPVQLTTSRKVYETMAKESIVEFEGLEVEATVVLTRLLRLSQITGGWLSSEDRKVQVGTEKIDAFAELLTEMQESDVQKVVVFVRFLNDLAGVSKVCKELGYGVLPLHGKISQEQRDRFVARFEETSEPYVFVSQISAGSLGISLTAANVAIFYSHSYSSIEYQQAQDRLHRIGQSRPVTYYHLLAEDTVDEAVWLALKTKKRVQELVLKNPELLM